MRPRELGTMKRVFLAQYFQVFSDLLRSYGNHLTSPMEDIITINMYKPIIKQ